MVRYLVTGRAWLFVYGLVVVMVVLLYWWV